MCFQSSNKALITLFAIGQFTFSWAQGFLGISAEVGGSYRYLTSEFPILNATYNVLEQPSFSAGGGITYTHFVGQRWFFQAAIAAQTNGYSTQLTENYPGELQADLTFGEVSSALEMVQSFVQLNTPLICNYIIKTSDAQDWHVFAGAGLQFSKVLNANVRWVGDEANDSKPNFAVRDQLKTGIRLQFGWMNDINQKNKMLFLMKFDQELSPAFNAPIKRYLNAFNFAFFYLFKA
jgi:hypothetical protein